MSSLSEGRAPRVGILRGVVPSTRPVLADARPRMPEEVHDSIATRDARQQAEEDGYRAGYEAGLAAASAEVRQEAERMTARQRSALDALVDAADQVRHHEVQSLHHVADQTALLALRIAEIVLQREILAAADPGREAIARAIGLVPDEGAIRIRLNPADLDALGDVGDLLVGRQVELVPDPQVTTGGCVAAVGATRIDAQIPTALGRVAEVLR